MKPKEPPKEPTKKTKPNDNITIPVEELEFRNGGDTLWVHGPDGATVLRLKLFHGKFVVDDERCKNPCSHVDAMVDSLCGDRQDVGVCLSNDAKVNGEPI